MTDADAREKIVEVLKRRTGIYPGELYDILRLKWHVFESQCSKAMAELTAQRRIDVGPDRMVKLC